MTNKFVSRDEAISQFEDRLDELFTEADIVEHLLCGLHRGDMTVEEAHDEYVDRLNL